MRIGIISDLHCRHSASEAGINTNLFSDKLRKPANQHPVQSLIKYLESDPIKVDYLICPGDIADKTDQQGFITGWGYLEELSEYLEAKELLACLGNHDVDSRGKFNSYNTYDIPKRLKDNFPFKEKKHRNEYYSDSYTLVQRDDVVFFVFNSVHSHTNPKDAENSLITDEMLESIEDDLKKLPEISYRVAFTHHHPIKHSNVGFKYKDIDVIEKGEKLLDLLEKYHFQVFIHGHKHEPRIVRYNNLPVFASGSFSSLQNLPETNSQNYFHVLTLHPHVVKGTFENFEFTNILGWEKACGTKIKYSFGFGAKLKPDEFSKSLDEFMISKSLRNLSYSDFISEFPDYDCFLPTEQEYINEILNSTYNISVIQGRSNDNIEFIKR
jgi:predicted phosphodiesterase